jgi:hypothetical protein
VAYPARASRAKLFDILSKTRQTLTASCCVALYPPRLYILTHKSGLLSGIDCGADRYKNMFAPQPKEVRVSTVQRRRNMIMFWLYFLYGKFWKRVIIY